jgi:hypothetical protein
VTGRGRRRNRLLIAVVLVLSAVLTISPVVHAIGFLEAVIARAAIGTIGLKERERDDRRAVNARRDRRLAEVAAAEAALEVKADRGWLTPQQVAVEQRRLEGLRQAYAETARRERQIISYQTRRRIDERFRSTLRDAIKVASGADPRAVDFVVDIFEGRNPLEAAVEAAISDPAGVADPRQPFIALRDQLQGIERAVSALGGAETLAIRARVQQALREATGLAIGDGEPPDDKLRRLREISGELDEAAARLRAIRDDLVPESPGIAAERFASDEEWALYASAIQALDSPAAKQRVTAAIWRRAVDRVVDITDATGLELTPEQLLALSRDVVEAWVEARLENGLEPGEAIDIDALVRTAVDQARAAAGLDPLFAGPEPPATPEPMRTATPEPTAQAFESYVGQWSTTYGDMALADGSGTYSSDNGRLAFEVTGRTLDGFWIEDGSARECESAKSGSQHWGRIVVDFDAAYTSFSGSWGYCDDEPDQGSWTGTREGP